MAGQDSKNPISTRLLILILILTAISSLYVIKEVIYPHIDARIAFEQQIIAGTQGPPYQYRVFKPILARILELAISPLIHSPLSSHLVSHSLITVVVFLGIYLFFYIFLRKFFSERSSIIGILLLQAVIPLAVTGYYMVGDFIALLFYILGFLIFMRNKDFLLPILVAVATFNREQSGFLIVFYVIFQLTRGQIWRKRSLFTIGLSAVLFLIVYLGIRYYYGFMPSTYSIALHISHNLGGANLFGRILPLWLAEFAGFFLLSLIAYSKTDKFFRLSFLSLGVYLLLFFLKGNLWEMAKFLPAYLILIPMTVQALTWEFPPISSTGSESE